MADSLSSRQGNSDEFIDPYCDPCYEDEGLNVRVRGFCKDCVQFLCSDCHRVHRNIQACRHHDVVHGEVMPKSQAEKPARFEYCDVHSKILKDVFCCEHKILLCTLCSLSDHKGCSIRTIEDTCEIIDVSETGALYDKIKVLQDSLKSAQSALDNSIRKIKDQQEIMLRDAQKTKDQAIARLNKLFNDIKKEIQTSCQSQIDILSNQYKKSNDMVTKLDSPLARVGELKATPVDTNAFLRLQDIVSCIKKIIMEHQDSYKQHKSTSFSFIPSKPIQELLSSSVTLGTIRSSHQMSHSDILIPEILFPDARLDQTVARPKVKETQDAQNPRKLKNKPLISKSTKQLSKIKATKQGTYNIRMEDDTSDCFITGMAITKDRRILMTDNTNSKVKMFSHDMKFLSSVSVADKPRDIALISDKEAVVTADNKSLYILGISDNQLTIKTITRLSYDVRGICRCNDKLVVTSPSGNPATVKLIEQTGRVYWSVPSDQQGPPLFDEPWYVSSHGDGISSTVVVTEVTTDSLTLLKCDTGEVIGRRQLQMKFPEGVTMDSTGNVYVCYWSSELEVAVLSGDLSKERILLSRQQSENVCPKAIVYDEEGHRLVISYYFALQSGYNKVDTFLLS